MTQQTLPPRMAQNGLRLNESDMPAFAELVADVDRVSAWLRRVELTYADEPAICFAAPKR